MTNPLHIEVSSKADEDLVEIFDYTVLEFGLSQAIKYTSEFESAFKYLSKSPTVGRQRNEINEGVRSFNKNSHIVFYRILPDRIRILRVLHFSRDLPRYF